MQSLQWDGTDICLSFWAAVVWNRKIDNICRERSCDRIDFGHNQGSCQNTNGTTRQRRVKRSSKICLITGHSNYYTIVHYTFHTYVCIIFIFTHWTNCIRMNKRQISKINILIVHVVFTFHWANHMSSAYTRTPNPMSKKTMIVWWLVQHQINNFSHE